MYLDVRGCVDRDLHGLVFKDVLRDDGALDGRDAEDVDPGWPWSCRVLGIRAVTGNIVVDDDVIIKVLVWTMSVECHTGKAIPCQFVMNYHVARHRSTRQERENTDSC